jgi:Ca2+-binding RTX toxin-like protein
MTTVKYARGFDQPLDSLVVNGLQQTTTTETKVTWESLSNFYTLTVHGKDLALANGSFTVGTIDKVTFRDANDNLLATVKGDFDATDLGKYVNTGGLDDALLSGNDKVTGSEGEDYLLGLDGADKIIGGNGADELSGGRGHDILIGGRGADTFDFFQKSGDYKGDGHDVIADFDAVGSHGHHDYLRVIDYQSITQSGHDTVISFADGETLTLLDVKRSDVTDADFLPVMM